MSTSRVHPTNLTLPTYAQAAATQRQYYVHLPTSDNGSSEAGTRPQRPSISMSSSSSFEHRHPHSFSSPIYWRPHLQQPHSADGSPPNHHYRSRGFNSSPIFSPPRLCSADGTPARTSLRSWNNGHQLGYGRFHNPHPPKEPGLNARGRRKMRRAMERAASGQTSSGSASGEGDNDEEAAQDSIIPCPPSAPEQQTFQSFGFDWSPASSNAGDAISPGSLNPTALPFLPTTPPRRHQSSVATPKSATPLSVFASPFTPRNLGSSVSASTHSRNFSNASTTLTMATTVEEECDELDKLQLQYPATTTTCEWQSSERKPSLGSVKHECALKAWLRAKMMREENETAATDAQLYAGLGQVHYVARPSNTYLQSRRLSAVPVLPLYSSLYVAHPEDVFELNDETPRAASFPAQEEEERIAAPYAFQPSPTKIALCAEVVPGTTNPWSLSREEWDQRPNTTYTDGKQFCYDEETEREALALLQGLGLFRR